MPDAGFLPLQHLPLSGIRVLDLSRVFAGPHCGRILADLGADVVKVEPPDGDVTRIWGRRVAGLSTYFTLQNAGKRNVSIDLLAPGGPELIADLAAAADVMIENFRPGVLDRAGLTWDALSARNPRLILLSISGFGAGGPESQRPAYASVLHAEGGLVARFGRMENGDPADAAVSVADAFSALHGVIGVQAALRSRDQTGVGQRIDLAMLDVMCFSDDVFCFDIDGTEPDRINGEVWQTGIGPIVLAGGARWAWQCLNRTHGLVDQAGPDADIPTKASSRRAAILAYFATFSELPALETALESAGLAWGVVKTGREILDSPTLVHRQTVQMIDDRGGSTREVLRSPYVFSGQRSQARGPASHRGEHNAEVLAEWLGSQPTAIETLRSAGVLASDQWADDLRTAP